MFSDDTLHRFYRNRPEWADVKPLPQDEDKARAVVQIAYSPEFVDVHDYLRSVMRNQELSPRAFHLTSDALRLNAANYSAWHYRRDILHHLLSEEKSGSDKPNQETARDDDEEDDVDWDSELQFIADMIEEHPKNYQVWFHRRWLLEQIYSPEDQAAGSKELLFIEGLLEGDDAKNYHAWEHRQWVLRRFNIWDEELAFLEKLISQDFRNNSAWNQRFVVVQQTTGFTPEVVAREATFAEGYIRLAPSNESAWNYLRGVYSKSRSVKGGDLSARLCNHPQLRKMAEEVVATELGASCAHPYALLVDWHASFLEKNAQTQDKEVAQLCRESMRTVQSHLELLSLQVDRVRLKYWAYVRASLEEKFPHFVSSEEGDPAVAGETGGANASSESEQGGNNNSTAGDAAQRAYCDVN